jgi:hypothetical protein
MKKLNVTRFTTGVAIAAAALMLSGCGTTLRKMYNSSVSHAKSPFYLAYDTPVEPIRDQAQVATLTAVSRMVIDGIDANKSSMRSSNGRYWQDWNQPSFGTMSGNSAMGNMNDMENNTATVDVLPGEHKVEIISRSGYMVTTSSASHNFEAGKVYLFMKTMGPLGNLIFEEITDPATLQKIAEKRRTAVFEDKK